MEVMEELPGPVIIITPPQEHCQGPQNITILLFCSDAMAALWLNGELRRGKNEFTRLLNVHCLKLQRFNVLEYSVLSESQFCLLVNVKLGVTQLK